MALTFTEMPNAFRPKHTIGDLLVKFVQVTFDSSYLTGGMAITPANFGLTRIVFVSVNAQSGVVTKTVSWDATNSKLLVVSDGGTPVEVANASDQSAVVVQLAVFGY